MTETYAPPGPETTFDYGDTLRPGDGPLSILRGIKKAALEKEETLNKNRELQQLAFDGAIRTACDWLEATGGEAINEETFQNLYDNRYASITPAEVLEIFYDWEDYQSVAQSYFEEREDPETTKKALVENLRNEADLGLVPTVFFDKYETYRVDNPSGKNKLVRYRLKEKGAAEDDIILQRYYKYLVVDYVTRNHGPEDEISEERKINIALGFKQETKTLLSGFYSALRKSNGLLTEEQVMLATEELGGYDYIYPESRKNHLKVLVEAGRSKPETQGDLGYYYDLRTKKLLVLGCTALSQLVELESQNYLKLLSSQKKLSLGKSAVKAFDKHGSDESRIRPLESLLADNNFSLKANGENRNRYRNWSKELYLEYGRWLTQMVDLDEKILTRAHRLGLGPGAESFSSPKRFGSLTQYFLELGFTNRIPKGKMDDLSPDAVIDHIKKVAELNEGKVTIAILRDYYQSQAIKGAPSIWILEKITNGRLSELVEAAGFKVHNKKYGAEGCLDMVKEFVRREDRYPTAKDFDKCPGLPSRPTIYRYFESLPGLKAVFNEEVMAA